MLSADKLRCDRSSDLNVGCATDQENNQRIVSNLQSLVLVTLEVRTREQIIPRTVASGRMSFDA